MNKAKDIQEGNDLIIRSPFVSDVHKKWLEKALESGEDFYKERLLPELKYHTSWDWLMPVVEKIDEVLKDMTLFNETLGEDLSILNSDQVNLFTPIKYVWEAIIQFIEWYNQNKTS